MKPNWTTVRRFFQTWNTETVLQITTPYEVVTADIIGFAYKEGFPIFDTLEEVSKFSEEHPSGRLKQTLDNKASYTIWIRVRDFQGTSFEKFSKNWVTCEVPLSFKFNRSTYHYELVLSVQVERIIKLRILPLKGELETNGNLITK